MGEVLGRMRKGCLRVVSLGTSVMGVAACPDRAVGRCIGIDASLSLSLSLLYL
jgi:hypothetical protein